jgi:hypothetical protein
MLIIFSFVFGFSFSFSNQKKPKLNVFDHPKPRLTQRREFGGNFDRFFLEIANNDFPTRYSRQGSKRALNSPRLCSKLVNPTLSGLRDGVCGRVISRKKVNETKELKKFVIPDDTLKREPNTLAKLENK